MSTDRRKFLGAVGLAAAAGAAGLAGRASAQQTVQPAAGGACPPEPVYPAVPAAAPGPIRRPVSGQVPPLKNATDYDALRQKRIAEIDNETKYINFRDIQPPTRKRQNRLMGVPPGIKATTITITGADGAPMPMRIYMPENAKKPVGLYLHTHGGGWAGYEGFDDGQDGTNCEYVQNWGCAVAQPDFRVSWDAKFPAAIDDCFAAYKYILDKGPGMGIDTKRIGIGGGCTGGNIATVVSLMARDAKIQKPAIQWLWSTVFDTRNHTQSYDEFGKYSLTLDTATTVTSFYLAKKEDTYDWRSSPILHPTMKGASPALIWAGEWEVLRDESRNYANRMRDAGCDVTYIEGPKQPHAGIYTYNPETGEPTAYAKKTLPEINRIMRKYIGPK